MYIFMNEVLSWGISSYDPTMARVAQTCNSQVQQNHHITASDDFGDVVKRLHVYSIPALVGSLELIIIIQNACT